MLHIGIDDTDSIHGMCTTYLAYRIVHEIRDMVEFADYPRLVRLNPNIPYRTRGNGAVSLSVKTDRPDDIKDIVFGLLRQHSDISGGANPGLVFYQGAKVPAEFAGFAGAALCRFVRMEEARRFAGKYDIETHHIGNGRGLVGALGAITYGFSDCTAEMLCYRRPEMFGRRRIISTDSVRRMQERTYPVTFGSYDETRNRMLIAPHGPDPVFYGLRGEDPAALCRASGLLRFDESPTGHMIFRTNQGTGDHLLNEMDPSMPLYASGTVRGTLSAAPVMHRGGYVTFILRGNNITASCIVYRPTGLAHVAMGLEAGDVVVVGGGIGRATALHPRTLNVELIDVIHLVPKCVLQNPRCARCSKSMKSKGAGQGFECGRCGSKMPSKVAGTIPRTICRRLYLPHPSAQRHLTRPAQRQGLTNRIDFDGSVMWFAAYPDGGGRTHHTVIH